MGFIETAELLAFCRADRDALLAEMYGRLGVTASRPVPAELLDAIIEDVLGMSLVPRALSGHVLGHCDFIGREIAYNTRIPEITLPRTKEQGVINSTKAHELGHVRLGHERELREERDCVSGSLFELAPLLPIVCHRHWKRSARMSAAERQREYQADVYASVFLVPLRQLLEHEEARLIHDAWRRQEALSSRRLWALVLALGDVFGVTGALMARRLDDLGWIVRRERALAVNPQGWLPLDGETPAADPAGA